MESGQLGYDLTFELNEFQQPKISSELELIKNVLLFVLFGKPGQYPSLPNIGLDINDLLYSYYDEIDVDQLKMKISQQCEMLGVYLDSGVIQIKKLIYQNQPSLIIYIEGKETYPAGYMKDNLTGNTGKYLIGISYDEFNQLIYDIKQAA